MSVISECDAFFDGAPFVACAEGVGKLTITYHLEADGLLEIRSDLEDSEHSGKVVHDRTIPRLLQGEAARPSFEEPLVRLVRRFADTLIARLPAAFGSIASLIAGSSLVSASTAIGARSG